MDQILSRRGHEVVGNGASEVIAATTAMTFMALGQTNLVLAHAIEDLEDTPISQLEEERTE